MIIVCKSEIIQYFEGTYIWWYFREFNLLKINIHKQILKFLWTYSKSINIFNQPYSIRQHN